MREKRNVKDSPKDGPIATHLQAFEEPTDQPPLLPRPFSSILPKHCGTRIVVHQEEKKVAFLFVHARSSAEEDGSWRRWRKLLPFSGTHCSSGGADSSERADSRNRARENERRRARVVAVWPGTGGHPAVYLPFDATCWIQRAKHGRGGGEGERSTSARGVATPTPTRAVCKRSSVEDEAEGRFWSRADRGSIFLQDMSRFLGDILISHWKGSSGYFGITLVFFCARVCVCVYLIALFRFSFFLQYLCCYEMEIINNCSFWKFIHWRALKVTWSMFTFLMWKKKMLIKCFFFFFMEQFGTICYWVDQLY